MPFRWGIVGFGWVARDHMAPAIAAAAQQLVGVADPSPGARAKAEAAGLEAFGSAAELLERRPDAIYVATPNHLHLPPVAEAARAGIPVLCEKPMAATLGQAEEIAVAAEPVLYGTAFDQRHHPAHRATAREIADGAIGQVTAVRIGYACWVDPRWRPPGAENEEGNWRANPQAAGGGAVFDLALHGLDLAQLLLGEPLVRLHIELQRRVHDYPVDDGGMLSGRFASGALFGSHVAYNCPEALPRRRLEVIGDRGAIVAIDTMGQSAGGTAVLTCGRRGEQRPIAFDTGLSPFAAQAAAFADAVHGRPHDFSLSRDLTLMRLFAGAYDRAIACL
ncbi:MAG: Oxidoreductase, Gfo/Idh/MocA family [uncultured Sphingomonas sp.]|uniref:Oxidoreductase, Gfo/Idh/MocA family n=1 Tax=uncultured Sphingomonas sp. TaxID=158754 RepID=A0A6J4SAA4_9SPHN|nr:Gfo/Idh/MocA family oxidoreductase [uncultured Sphingomonas sp.]CAA9493058.1 MAG: Oxidoreductase, Gfo/Idh/MocA family [uncultured Sphingomonas sp.]